MQKNIFQVTVYLFLFCALIIAGCSSEYSKKKSNQSYATKKQEEIKENPSPSKKNTENVDVYIPTDERLTAEEAEKFSRDADETVPVILAGNSTSETLKAYLTQSFFNRAVRGGVTNEMSMDDSAVGMAETAMDMDGGAIATPRMAMADTAVMSVSTSARSMTKMAVAPTAAPAPPSNSAPSAAEAEESSAVTGDASKEAFSGTNTQEKGVDEGDIWKYDGEKFYVLSKAQNVYYPMIREPRMMIDQPMADEDRGEPVAVDGVAVDAVAQSDGDSSSEENTEGEKEAVEKGGSEEVEEKEVQSVSVSSKEIMPCPGCGNNNQKNAKLRIVGNNKETFSTTELGDLRADEMYLAGKKLVLVGNKRPSEGDWGDYRHWQQGVVNVKVMDITDPKMPKTTLTIDLQGHKIRTRRIDDHLYLVSRFSPYIEKLNYSAYTAAHMDANKKVIDELPITSLLPTITINGESKALIAPEQCWLTVMPKSNWGSPTITLVTKISVTTGAYSSTCVGGDVQGIYMSQNALYLYNTSFMTYAKPVRAGVIWNWQEGNTHIHKFELSQLGYKGSQLIDGVVGHKQASFRFGELKEGSLGVVTTKSEWRNPQHRLAILGEKDGQWVMKAMLPSLEKPAPIGKPNERIYSVRFMQDRAYIVTFQQTDPLYVIDLSVPDKPYIAGELKIPGFSDYLHPVGTDKLLGVGKDAATDERGNTITLGVKVSLFDVSDITQPKEAGSQIIGRRGSSTALSQNHLAFTGIQQENSYRFAFPIQVHEGIRTNTYQDPTFAYNDWLHTGLYLFEIKDDVFLTSGALITDQKSTEKSYGDYGERRGLIQGEQVYHLKNDQIYKSEWANPKGAEGPF